jgi:hypothetical protein
MPAVRSAALLFCDCYSFGVVVGGANCMPRELLLEYLPVELLDVLGGCCCVSAYCLHVCRLSNIQPPASNSAPDF